MATQHTPGPWLAQNVGGKGWFIVTEDDLILALTLKGNDSDEPDARLVAAAPDLLAALVDLKRFVEKENEWMVDDEGQPLCPGCSLPSRLAHLGDCIWPKVVAALAKTKEV